MFAGRAAFLLVGAMIATAMSANVFFWIIPGQRKVVAQMKAGQPVDPIHGQRAKQRSVHNTYFTLPVLVAMLSQPLRLALPGPRQLDRAGAADARRRADPAFVRRPPQGARRRQARAVGVRRGRHADALIGRRDLARAGAERRRSRPRPRRSTLAEVKAVVDQRCVMCHNAETQQKNVALHTPELIKSHAQAMYQQVVVLKLMPLTTRRR